MRKAILALAMALLASDQSLAPRPQISLGQQKPKKASEQKRIDAAEAKRKRKAEKRINNYAKGELGNAHIFMAKRKYEYMSKPCDCDVCTSKGGAA